MQRKEEHIKRALNKGFAAENFAQMVSALGGPTDLLENFSAQLPKAIYITDLVARESGLSLTSMSVQSEMSLLNWVEENKRMTFLICLLGWIR